MSRPASRVRPLPPSPHGPVVVARCACGERVAYYVQGSWAPEDKGWILLNGKWICRRCADEPRRKAP